MATPLFGEGPSPTRATHRKQLMNHVMDGMAKAKPRATWAEYPISPTTYEAGFRKISYKDMANAINGLAWWLQDTLGPGKIFETLAYLGGNDLRYNALLLASIKAGYKCLFTSPRNSVPAHINLFKQTECQTLIAPNPPPPFVAPILAAHDMRLLAIPSVDDLLNKTYPHFPYNKTYEEAQNDPIVVLHTSGTTGLPKPIIWTHAWAASWQLWNDLDTDPGFVSMTDMYKGVRVFTTLPPFHAGAMYGTLMEAIWTQAVIIFPLAGAMPSGQGVADALKYTKADTAVMAPPFMEEVGKKDDVLDFLSKNLDSIMFAGGDIPQVIGDKISKKMKMFACIGSTEVGLIPGIFKEGDWPVDDWKYFMFNPAALVEFERQTEGVYEAVIKRGSDPETLSPAFTIFPNLQEYRTKDLYVPHPTKPNMWRYTGRADDIIVFLNGEKTNPITMEQHIAMRPDVKAALVIGTLRLQAALLIEPATDKSLSPIEKAEFIENLWPTIQEANEDCPQHARIAKSFVLFTEPSKPMDIAGKGTIQRQPTLNKYVKEIDALYADADKISGSGSSAAQSSIDIDDEAAVQSCVRDSVATAGFPNFKDDEDFFANGMDSLKAIELTRSLKKNLAVRELEIITIYTNPSIALLAKAITQLPVQSKTSKLSREQSRRIRLEDSLTKYSHLVDEIVPSATSSYSARPDQKRVIALTGSTGALGSYILENLIENPAISHVYCLNRASDSQALQSTRNKSRGLRMDLGAKKVTFVTIDVAQERFGLESPLYKKLQSEITDIIHTAWTVNFNLPLTAYDSLLSGLVNLIAFAATASSSPSILFVSSISAVGSSPVNPRPEEILDDVTVSSPMGYGESKYIAERILDHAASNIQGLNIKVARVGQLAGPAYKPGGWNKQEWMPSLVISSLRIGAIPESLGSLGSVGSSYNDNLDLVPIDVLGDALVDFTLATIGSKAHGAVVLQPHNSHQVTWPALLQIFIQAAKSKLRKDLEVVSFSDWLRRLRADADTWSGSDFEENLERSPAVKLLSFYDSLETDQLGWFEHNGTKAAEMSEHLKSLHGIKAEWMEKWVADWTQGR